MIKSCINMKRDMDLVRKLLLAAESEEHGYVSKVEIPGYTEEQINYHAFLLGEAGLAKVANVTHNKSEGPEALLVNLTWAGHEFIDSARENTIWNQARDKINKIGGATLPIWTALLSELIKKQIGL